MDPLHPHNQHMQIPPLMNASGWSNASGLINASGTLTSLGGCRTRPEVVQAMAQIAGQFIPLEELHIKAGEHLASIIPASPGMTIGWPPGCRCNPFERALLIVGAELVQIGDAIRTRPEDLETAIQAGLTNGDHIAAVAHFVDAAAELPPKHHLWSLAQTGADLVIFSGSKDLRGPQTSGLMVGRADLIASARYQSAPHEHVVGRPMKAGKEIVAGMVAAVEHYLAEDETARFEEWEAIASYLKDHLGQIQGLQVRRIIPNQPFIQPAITPRLALSLQESSSHTAASLKTALWSGDPRIAVETVRGDVWINVHTLTMPEAEKIVQQVRKICS